MDKPKNIRLGLWLQKDKNGKAYMSGSFTYGSKIYVNKNDHKKSDKDPDYFVSFVPTEPKEQQAAPAAHPEGEGAFW